MQSLKFVDNISEISKSTLNGLEEKAFCKQNSQSDFDFDYSAIKFPIDNSESNFINSDNMFNHNVLFVEFDLNNNNTSKEYLRFLRDINNQFVDREIHFVLNV